MAEQYSRQLLYLWQDKGNKERYQLGRITATVMTWIALFYKSLWKNAMSMTLYE